MSKNNKNNPDARVEIETPFLSHLIELRDRLLRVVVVVGLITLGLMTVANKLYYYFSLPIQGYLPEGSQMLATGVVSPVFTPFKLALIAAFFIAIPFILYQAWAFIAPGLYKHEKRLAFPLLLSSVLLFYLGMLFAYFVVFPLVFQFTSAFVPEGVDYRPDIASYLEFSIKLFFAFGLAFEVPIATILMILTGMTTPESLSSKRPYIIVGAFTIGMLLTPPDIISQTLLAVPMWLLFELGIVFGRMLKRRRDTETPNEEDFRPLSDEELDDELDKAIAEEEKLFKQDKKDKHQDQ